MKRIVVDIVQYICGNWESTNEILNFFFSFLKGFKTCFYFQISNYYFAQKMHVKYIGCIKHMYPPHLAPNTKW